MSYTQIELIVFCKGIHFHLKISKNEVLFLFNRSLSLLNLLLLVFYVNNWTDDGLSIFDGNMSPVPI